LVFSLQPVTSQPERHLVVKLRFCHEKFVILILFVETKARTLTKIVALQNVKFARVFTSEFDTDFFVLEFASLSTFEKKDYVQR